jgi:hypothetical protein
VQYVIDAGDAVFAPKLRHLLGRACRIGQRRPKLADATLRTYAARLTHPIHGAIDFVKNFGRFSSGRAAPFGFFTACLGKAHPTTVPRGR